jgi:hypothetical protein
MNKSESIANLADALSKAQAEMEGAKKDMANPFFKSKYADLASVWDACREPLGKHGLSVSQMPETRDNQVIVYTILMHSTGEWLASELAMAPTKNDPQGIGSCITYARRYALSAIVGISPEDDDGNAASGTKNAAVRTTEPTPVAAPPKKAAAPHVDNPLVRGTPAEAQKAAFAHPDNHEPPGGWQGLPPREPGSDDEPLEACIDLPLQRALHRAAKDAAPKYLKPAEVDVAFRFWLKTEGYSDPETLEGSTKRIPLALFEEVKANAVKYMSGLK